MKYSISSVSRASFIRHSMPLALLIGALALSPWTQVHAGGTSGSVGGSDDGSRSTANPPGITGSESEPRTRGTTSPPTGTGERDSSGRTNDSMSRKGRTGSDTDTEQGTGTGGSSTGQSSPGPGTGGTTGTGEHPTGGSVR